MKAELTIRQGDVYIFRVDEFPEGDRVQDEQCKKAVLAYGEVTGHHHAIEDQAAVECFKILNKLYVNVKRDTILRHGLDKDFKGKTPDEEYHNEVKLPAGKYLIGIVEETDHIGQMVRRVID